MKDIHNKGLKELSSADYKRDLAELASAIERKDVAALERRKKNGFGALLHKHLVRRGKTIRPKP